MNAHSRYPDTGESGEAYDVERYSSTSQSLLEATRLSESLLKLMIGRATSAIQDR
jgi:hypothetical protein